MLSRVHVQMARERAVLIVSSARENFTPGRRRLIRKARPFTLGAREASPGSRWLQGAPQRVLVARQDADAGQKASGAAVVAALGVMDGTPRWRLYNE